MQSNVFCSQYETGARQMQCMQLLAGVSHCPVSQVGDSGGCPVATGLEVKSSDSTIWYHSECHYRYIDCCNIPYFIVSVVELFTFIILTTNWRVKWIKKKSLLGSHRADQSWCNSTNRPNPPNQFVLVCNIELGAAPLVCLCLNFQPSSYYDF